jgi:glutaconate CoA-transferase, subunit A
MLSHRIEKLLNTSELEAELAEAVRDRDGLWVAVGGVSLNNKPLNLLAMLLESGLSRIRYSGLSSCSVDLDLAVSQERVAETYVPVALFDGVKTWPHYRAAAESETIAAHFVDVATLMAGYFASAEGVPFHPVTAIGGSDVSKRNPLLEFIEDPRFGRVGIVRPISPDICVLHAQQADAAGNALIYGGTSVSERLLARASKKVYLTCDELVPVGAISCDRTPATIPGMYVDAVCHVPFGAWPGASPGLYKADKSYVSRYWGAADSSWRDGDATGMKAAARTLIDDLEELRRKGGPLER